MRIRSVTMTDFRGIRSATLDCSADVVLMYGRNGAGKTTVFDAIEYAMFQSVARLKELDDDAWDQHLPNVHGDGSLAVRLDFDDETFISARRSSRGERSGEWPGGSINAFVYDRLMRPGRFARRDIAPVHALMRATHLLLQKDMATLAASGALDSQKLAALTGSGYLERCREKAANALREARKRIRAAEQRMVGLIADQKIKDANALSWRKLLARRDTALRELASLALGELVPGDDLADLAKNYSLERLAAVGASAQKKYQATERVLASIRTLLSMAPSVVDETALMEEASRLSTERESAARLRSDLSSSLASVHRALQDRQSEHSALAVRHAATVRAHRAAKELIDAESTSARVTSQVSEVENSLNGADTEWEAASKKFEKARDETSGLQGKVAQTELRIKLLQDLQRAQTSAEHAVRTASAEATAAEADVAQGRERLAQAEKVALQVRNTFDQLFAAFNASASDVDKIITELRTLIAADHECPLCGTAFGTAAGLIASIEAQARRRSMSVSQAQEQIDSARHRRDDAIRREAELRNALDSAAARFERSSLQVQARTVELERIRAKMAEAASGRAVTSELLTLEASLGQVNVALESSRKESDSAQAAVDLARGLLQKHNTRRDELRNALFRIKSTVKSLTDALARESGETAVDSTVAALADALTEVESKLQAADVAMTGARADVLVLERDAQRNADMLASLEKDILTNSARLLQVREAKELRNIHLRTIGVPSDATRTGLSELEKSEEARRELLARVLDLSQELGSIVASTLSGDLQEAEKAVEAAEVEIQQADSDLQVLNAVSAKAQHWEARLRARVGAAIQNFVLPRQGEITRIFRSLIPNPFRFNRIDVRQADDGGLRMGLVFRNFESSHGSPEFFLSAAQMSVLALSIFLALSRSQSWSNLDTIMLDDPVQHLDDLDAVALLDGLRAVSRQPLAKQLIVSTCDRSLYHLMIRKFRLASAETPRSLIAMTLEDDLQNGIALTYDVGGPVSLSAAGWSEKLGHASRSDREQA